MLLNMFKMLLDKHFSQHSSANHVLSTLLSALFGLYVKIISLTTINLLQVPLGLCRAPFSSAHLCTHLLQASSDLACDSFRLLGLHKPLHEHVFKTSPIHEDRLQHRSRKNTISHPPREKSLV